jgi:hypothetical protein
MHLRFDASAAEWVDIEDDYGSRGQWEAPATWDDSPATESPWVEAGDWGDLEAPDGALWLEDDGWIKNNGAGQGCTSPALAVVALVVAVLALAGVIWLQSHRRRVVVVSERPLGLDLPGDDGVVPPAKREDSNDSSI